MTDESKVASPESIAKALGAIKDLAQKIEKGKGSGPTSTLKVETATGVGGSTQLYHTGSNSEPSSWAGSTKQGVSTDDGVSENGTDYVGGAGVKKALLQAVIDGKVKAEDVPGLLKAFGEKPEKGGDEDEEDGEKGEKEPKPDFSKGKGKKKVAKSFEEVLDDDDAFVDVAEGLDGLVKGLVALRDEIIAHVDTRIDSLTRGQDGFNKSLAGAVGNLAEALVTTASRVSEVESQPARGPKSVQANGFIEKSQKPVANYDKDTLSKALADLCLENKVSQGEVIAFETTGDITASLYNKAVAHIEGK